MENKMEQLDTIIENGLVVTEDVTQIMIELFLKYFWI